jgi:hypothetical protein
MRSRLSACPDAVELERVDKYLDQLRDALKDTNQKFIKLQVTCLLLLSAHYLFLNAEGGEIAVGNVKVSDLARVAKWFLVAPALLYCVGCCYGYLRVTSKVQ